MIEDITNTSVSTPAVEPQIKLYTIHSGELGREISLTRLAFSIPQAIDVKTIPNIGIKLKMPSQVKATATIHTNEKNTIHQLLFPHFLSLFANTTERIAAIKFISAPVYAFNNRKWIANKVQLTI